MIVVCLSPCSFSCCCCCCLEKWIIAKGIETFVWVSLWYHVCMGRVNEYVYSHTHAHTYTHTCIVKEKPYLNVGFVCCFYWILMLFDVKRVIIVFLRHQLHRLIFWLLNERTQFHLKVLQVFFSLLTCFF